MTGLRTTTLAPSTRTDNNPNFASPAQVCIESLGKAIDAFEKSMTPKQEVATYLASFGSRILLRLEALYARGPVLVCLEGRVETGERVTLLQHHSQVNILLTVSQVDGDRVARRLGFLAGSDPEGK